MWASLKIFISASVSLLAATSALSSLYPGIILQDTIIMSRPLVWLLHTLFALLKSRADDAGGGGFDFSASTTCHRGLNSLFPVSLSLSHTHTHTSTLHFPVSASSFVFPSFLYSSLCACYLLTFSCSVSHCICLVVLLPRLIVFSLSSLSPLGQGAPWDHPAGESQHQGGGGAKETCECCLIRDLTLRSYVTDLLSSVTVFVWCFTSNYLT